MGMQTGRPVRRIRRRLARRKRRVVRVKRTPAVTRLVRVTRWSASPAWTLVNALSSAGATINGNYQAAFLGVTTNGIASTPSYCTFGLGFSLADLATFSDLQALWTSYRLVKVKCKMVPVFSNIEAPAPGVTPEVGGFVHSARIVEEIAAPAASGPGIDFLRRRPDYKVQRVNKVWQKTIRPLIQVPVYGGATPAYTLQKSPWLSSSYTDANYFGLNMIFELYSPSATQTTLAFKFETEYFLEFKGQR